MSGDLNRRIDMSTYLNKECCRRLLGQCVASSVKNLNDLVDIEKLKKNGKRRCHEENKEKIMEELKALNNIIESINVYLDLIS
jgi:hypothetical protein